MLAVVNTIPMFYGLRTTFACLKKALLSGSTNLFHNDKQKEPGKREKPGKLSVNPWTATARQTEGSTDPAYNVAILRVL